MKRQGVDCDWVVDCDALRRSLHEFLGGTGGIGSRSDVSGRRNRPWRISPAANSSPYVNMFVIKDSEYGRALMQFLDLEKGMQGRFLGDMQAL